ncbi:unnamed protein product, partial [Pylaiella littoralis]
RVKSGWFLGCVWMSSGSLSVFNSRFTAAPGPRVNLLCVVASSSWRCCVWSPTVYSTSCVSDLTSKPQQQQQYTGLLTPEAVSAPAAFPSFPATTSEDKVQHTAGLHDSFLSGSVSE